MKFDTPATTNPIDQMKVVGKPIPRIDGHLKTTGQAKYAYEWHDASTPYAYGYPVGASIARGRIKSMDIEAAEKAPGVLAVVTTHAASVEDDGVAQVIEQFLAAGAIRSPDASDRGTRSG